MGQKRICLGITVLVLAIYGGNLSVKAEEKSTVTQGMRTINAVRTETPPMIDGKLDDGCWQKTKPITDFLSMNSDQMASYQSIGYICYDETHLYIGMKCLMPKGIKPGVEKGSSMQKKPHDTYIFADDIVEIMIDPGRTQSDYYQLVISAYGSTFDTYRKGGGAQHDPTWNGDWTSGAHIEDGYWSMEMSVPFHNLGISPEVGSTWGINLCRETKRPNDEYSSIANRGSSNHAKDFAILKGLNVNFNKYLYQIGPAVTQLDWRDGKPISTFSVPVKNTTGKTREVKVERWYAGSDGKETVESKVVTLAVDETTSFPAEELEVETLSPKRTDAYVITSVSGTKKISVSDSKDGTILSLSLVKRPYFCEAMRVEVEDPWKRDMSLEKTGSVKLKVHTLLVQEQLKKGELVVKLSSKETGKEVASKSFSGPGEMTDVTFPTGDILWGAYEVSAVFKDTTGKERISSRAVATVLPGGKQHIKVLNNLVSELMDAKDRGLLGEKEIEFMNPRDGWVFFSISGAGHVTLDSDTKPLAEVFQMYVPATEVMRLLPSGRHVLKMEGEFDHVVVRAVPELIYSCHPSAFSWDFLKKEVLPSCNTILGGTNDVPAMREWIADGKKWVTFAIAPSHGMGGSESVPADKYYEVLSAHEGFNNPLLSGIVVDQVSSSSVEQKMEFARTFARMIDNPKFQGKAFRPEYEGGIFSTEGDKAFMKIILEAGWNFSFYFHLMEPPTEEHAKNMIRNTVVQKALGCNREIYGSLSRGLVTLGYMSHFPDGQTQNVNPEVNFKVFMQMEMETLANDPAFFGLYGFWWYYSPYVDEENLRWGGQLFRHYGIEGNTTKLTNDPYRLTHIKNPDFEEGTKGWTITESKPDNVSVKTHLGYGNLQGRFLSGPKGDTFLVTRRSAKGANKFSQEIKDLTPGRVYSMKMVTADYRNIMEEKSVNEKEAISIQLDNVELVSSPGKNVQETFQNHYGHPLGKFSGEYHAYMNFHWYVFRAKGNTAKITVSDWITPNEPGGPIGQEIMYNFIEIQPYLEN